MLETHLIENEFHWSNTGADDHKLVNVHAAVDCGTRPCVIHKPSKHHMSDWPLNWRQFDGWMNIKPSHFERICEHGIGHPDPDDMLFHGDNISTHACDGCCYDK